MKKSAMKGFLLLLLLLLVITFAGCGEKDKKEAANKIVGEWQLVSY